MAQWVTVLIAKTDDLSWIPELTWWKTRSHTFTHACTPYTKIYGYENIKKVKAARDLDITYLSAMSSM